MKNTITNKITSIFFIIFFPTLIVLSAMHVFHAKCDYVTALQSRSRALASSLQIIQNNFSLHGLEHSEELSVLCREIVADNPPLSYCLFTTLDGKVLAANDPFFLSLNFQNNKSSITSPDHQTISFYDTAKRLSFSSGKAGFIHIGFNAGIVSAKVAKLWFQALVVFLTAFVFCFTIIRILINKNIVLPLGKLLHDFKKISEGNHTKPLEILNIHEFHQLAQHVNLMSAILLNREEELSNNYHELQKIHKELKESYLKLENLTIELEKSEDIYRSLMKDAGDAIVVIGENGMIRMANQMAEEIFGCSAADIVGTLFVDLLHALKVENENALRDFFEDALRKKHIDGEIEFINKSGARIIGRIHANSIKWANETLVQAIIRDATKEREVLQNLEKSAADLARLNKMKDSFIGLASHELKTPLTVIMGYAELILTNMSDKIDKNALAMVENISNAASRLDSIVRDMVDVSLIEEKQLHLKLEDIDLNNLVSASINELRFFFSLRKQELVIDLEDSLPTIKGDSVRLMQLFSNLLGNAIKFTPDGGKIRVASRMKYFPRNRMPFAADYLHHADHNMFVEIVISDTGIGLDPDDHLRIFEKFYEVGNIEEHSSGKVAFKGKGAGLGLAIAKGIVEMHGGRIWVESSGYDPSGYPGSDFHVVLPILTSVSDITVEYLGRFKN